MNNSTAPHALELLDALLRRSGIHPHPDLDGDNLTFLHIGCVSVSATEEHYVVEHVDDDGDQLRRIECAHDRIVEVVKLVRAYRTTAHPHSTTNARTGLRLVKGAPS